MRDWVNAHARECDAHAFLIKRSTRAYGRHARCDMCRSHTSRVIGKTVAHTRSNNNSISMTLIWPASFYYSALTPRDWRYVNIDGVAKISCTDSHNRDQSERFYRGKAFAIPIRVRRPVKRTCHVGMGDMCSEAEVPHSHNKACAWRSWASAIFMSLITLTHSAFNRCGSGRGLQYVGRWGDLHQQKGHLWQDWGRAERTGKRG